MSVTATGSRPVALIREEIEDLRKYLAGLPTNWRDSGAFLAYEEKLRALDEELAVARIGELVSALDPRRDDRPEAEAAAAPARRSFLVAYLALLDARYVQAGALANANRLLRLWLTIVLGAIALVGMIALLLLPDGRWHVLLLCLEVSVAVSACFAWTWQMQKRTRRDARLQCHLAALRNELLQMRDAIGAADPQPGACPMSSRVEPLIEGILSSLPSRRRR